MVASNVVEFPTPAASLLPAAEVVLKVAVPVSDVTAAASVLGQIDVAIQLALTVLTRAPEYGADAALDAAADIVGALSRLLA